MSQRQGRLLAVLALVPLAATALGACGGSDGGDDSDLGFTLVAAGKLTVCSDMPYPPFEMLEGDKAVGFDIDVVTEIANDLGLELNVIQSSFESIESAVALDTGQCDLSASAIGMEEDRKAKMDFSEPYYETVMGVMVADDSISTLEDLAGKDIGTQMGTTGETWAESEPLIADTLRGFETLGDQMAAMEAGEVVAIINDTPALAYYGQGDYKIITGLNKNVEAPQGIAIKKGNQALVDLVNTTLARIQSDGTMDELLAKWNLDQ
jgi:polar amino acid transport system substrate-binding protein